MTKYYEDEEIVDEINFLAELFYEEDLGYILTNHIVMLREKAFIELDIAHDVKGRFRRSDVSIDQWDQVTIRASGSLLLNQRYDPRDNCCKLLKEAYKHHGITEKQYPWIHRMLEMSDWEGLDLLWSTDEGATLDAPPTFTNLVCEREGIDEWDLSDFRRNALELMDDSLQKEYERLIEYAEDVFSAAHSEIVDAVSEAYSNLTNWDRVAADLAERKRKCKRKRTNAETNPNNSRLRDLLGRQLPVKEPDAD